jgi:hypothetical protein
MLGTITKPPAALIPTPNPVTTPLTVTS